ncbi:MAG: RNA-binding protein [Thermoproteota archaeon]|nr:RNA-binding protein [Thermoproteota archaeon]
MKAHSLSKREVRDIAGRISKNWPKSIIWNEKSLNAIETEKSGRLLIGEGITVIQTKDDLIVPHLVEKDLLSHFPNVIVDMGAVGFVCNGANIMRPGITHFDDFGQSEIVVVKDQVHNKSLAIGLSRVNDETMQNLEKGPVISNLHYVGDIFWNLKKEMRL